MRKIKLPILEKEKDKKKKTNPTLFGGRSKNALEGVINIFLVYELR